MALSKYVRVLVGRWIGDKDFDEGDIPTHNQKLALDNAPNALTSTNPVTDKTYVDNKIAGLDWQESVTYHVEYRKAGAPIGTTAADTEKCLNTLDYKLHTFTAGAPGSWDAGVALVTNNRYIHKDTGTDVSGDSGTETKDNKIYQYNGATLDSYTPNKGWACLIEDQAVDYTYNGTAWVLFASIVDHNSLSGLQGGTTAQYYHLEANEQAGVHAATAITGTNPPQTLSDRDRMPVCFKFCYKAGFAKSQSDVEFYEASGSFQRILMPSDGSLVKTTLQSTTGRTAGTLTCEPTIDGTKVTDNSLDLVLDGSTTNDDKAEVAPATTNLTFTSGQKIGVKATSDGSWAPEDSDLEFCIYVVFNT